MQVIFLVINLVITAAAAKNEFHTTFEQEHKNRIPYTVFMCT